MGKDYICSTNNCYMKRLSLIAVLATSFFGLDIQAQSDWQDYYNSELNTITTSVPFLSIAPDSRAGAMGDVGVATAPDQNSIHWNAAKLAFIGEDNGISLTYTPWLSKLVPEISLTYLSGYKRLNDRSAFGGSLRYFSLGEIQFTDQLGNNTSTFSPNEFAFDMSYAMKLSERFSGGLAMRYIYSNLTGGMGVESYSVTKAGTSFAVDLSGYYESKEFELDGKDAQWAAGFNFSNIGNKISYTESGDEDFLPMNARLGGRLTMELDAYNTIAFAVDVNKLLAPTPPIYYLVDNERYNFGPDGVAAADPENDIEDDIPADEDNPQSIVAGQDPNVGVIQGVFQSFNDAPGGMEEELRELMYSVGMEYWYDKQFAFRAGYFNEHKTKGGRQYFTMGFGVKMNVFSLDFAYLIPATAGVRSPLENTLRFTMLFDLGVFYTENK